MAKRALVSSKQTSWSKQLLVIALIVLPFIALGAFGWYYYNQYQYLNRMTAEEFSQRDNDKIIKKIGKLISLPGDESPEIAVVKDKEALSDNPFFEPAENGDYLIVYSEAKQAIIYRPSEDRLVKVGPLNVQDQVKVSVIGAKAEREVMVQKLVDLKLSATDGGDAKGSYGETAVVDVSGENATVASQIAAVLGGKVTSLPQGEDTPEDVDIIVIVGETAAEQNEQASQELAQ